MNVAAHNPSGEGAVQVRTDADGRFEVLGLSLGPHRVAASAPDGLESSPADIDLAGGDADVTLVVLAGLKIPARVVSAETGQPVAGALVKVDSAEMRKGAMGGDLEHSDAEGRLTLAFPPGTRTAELLVGAPGHAIRMVSVPVVPGSPITLAVERAGGTLVLNYQKKAPGDTLVLLHQGSREIAGFLSGLLDPRGTGRTHDGRLRITGMSPGPYSACSMDMAQYQAGAAPAESRCADGIVAAGSELVLHVPVSP